MRFRSKLALILALTVAISFGSATAVHLETAEAKANQTSVKTVKTEKTAEKTDAKTEKIATKSTKTDKKDKKSTKTDKDDDSAGKTADKTVKTETKSDKSTEKDAKTDKSDEEAEKTDISKAYVQLSYYMMTVDGKTHRPKVKAVTVKNEKGEKIKIDEKDYTVTYQDEAGKSIKSPKKRGVYTVIVTAKESSDFEGTASKQFELIGKSQNLEIKSTDIVLSLEELIEGACSEEKTETKKEENENIGKTKKVGDKIEKVDEPISDYTLFPYTDGDGTGFSYTTSNSKVLTVDKEGNIYCKKPGTAKIMIKTEGDKLSEPARLRVRVTVVQTLEEKNEIKKNRGECLGFWLIQVFSQSAVDLKS